MITNTGPFIPGHLLYGWSHFLVRNNLASQSSWSPPLACFHIFSCFWKSFSIFSLIHVPIHQKKKQQQKTNKQTNKKKNCHQWACSSACQCLGTQWLGVDTVCGSMKLMVSVEVRPLKSSEISALPEGAEQELSLPTSYPGHHWQINSALLWIWCPYHLQRWFHLEVEFLWRPFLLAIGTFCAKPRAQA